MIMSGEFGPELGREPELGIEDVVDQDDEGRVTDPEKAHAMAHAENAGRTLARNLRVGSREGSMNSVWAGLADDVADKSGEEAGRAYDEGREIVPDNTGRVNRKIGRIDSKGKIVRNTRALGSISTKLTKDGVMPDDLDDIFLRPPLDESGDDEEFLQSIET